jgi:hypothetical protein
MGTIFAITFGPHRAVPRTAVCFCLDCLQRRLGRKLKLADFTAVVPRAWKP